MKPEQFIRDFGVEKARELLNADSDFKTYCLIDKSFWGESEGTCSFCVDLDGVKRLVESVDLVESWGGIDDVKLYDLSHCKDKPESTGYKLLQAIADYESIYGGGDES
ncbi:hypothetical protein OXU89_18835 [Acinetobacter baumannii]|uniref:hypothetical protein n=1 Tax=Acinetobacter baumannii TaxID=470 RepID=UPI00186898EF|nr:hypothetical protein [Acinetobacter baumannii]MCY6389528.1 hypothetical protein [Acinetobacter baumannii]